MNRCHDCQDEIKEDIQLQCIECVNHFHFTCSGMSQEDFKAMSNFDKDGFRCHPCKFKRWERNRYSRGGEAAAYSRGRDGLSSESLVNMINNNFEAMLSMVEDLHMELNNKFVMLTEKITKSEALLLSLQQSVADLTQKQQGNETKTVNVLALPPKKGTNVKNKLKKVYNQGLTVEVKPSDQNEDNKWDVASVSGYQNIKDDKDKKDDEPKYENISGFFDEP